MSMLLGLFIAVIISILIKSREKLRTLGYGLLAGIAILAAMAVLTALLQLNSAIMGHAIAPLILIIPLYVMWTHAKTTVKPPTVGPPDEQPGKVDAATD